MRRVIRPLLIALTLLLASCGSRSTVAPLDQRPAGKVDEVLSWQAHATGSGPTHAFRFGIDIDEAKMMGWSRTDQQTRVMLDVSLVGPETEKRAALTFALTAMQQVGEDKERNTVQMAFLPAGELMKSGFRRLPSKDAFQAKPTEGDWTLRVRMRVPHGGNTRALWTVRSVRVDVLANPEAEGVLREWIELPPAPFSR